MHANVADVRQCDFFSPARKLWLMVSLSPPQPVKGQPFEVITITGATAGLAQSVRNLAAHHIASSINEYIKHNELCLCWPCWRQQRHVVQQMGSSACIAPLPVGPSGVWDLSTPRCVLCQQK